MDYMINKDRSRLTIYASKSERKVLHSYPEGGRDSIHADSTLRDCLESLTCNSELTWVYPHETGDLTDAPMLGILGEEGVKEYTVFLPNHGLRETGRDGHNVMAVPILERWAFMSYAVRSLLQDLRDTGQAVLVSGN